MQHTLSSNYSSLGSPVGLGRGPFPDAPPAITSVVSSDVVSAANDSGRTTNHTSPTYTTQLTSRWVTSTGLIRGMHALSQQALQLAQ